MMNYLTGCLRRHTEGDLSWLFITSQDTTLQFSAGFTSRTSDLVHREIDFCEISNGAKLAVQDIFLVPIFGGYIQDTHSI